MFLYIYMNRLLIIEYIDNKKDILKKIDKNLYELHKRYIKIKLKKSKINKIQLYGFDGKLKHTYKSLNINKIILDILIKK